MKKLNFEAFAASKVEAKQIMGGKVTCTTYTRPSNGTTGTDEVEDAANCTTYVRYAQDPTLNYSYVRPVEGQCV